MKIQANIPHTFMYGITYKIPFISSYVLNTMQFFYTEENKSDSVHQLTYNISRLKMCCLEMTVF